ncbi:MAG: mechanosensitive ion channel family protein [Acidobacteriota bacterium]|nr:mechanosensitive ion channel family protein [Acidobacteriota bacterium]
MDFQGLFDTALAWLITTGPRILILVAVTLLILKAVKILSARISKLMIVNKEDPEAEKRARTLGAVLRNLLRVVVLIMAALTLLAQLGVEIAPLLATAGIAGLAIGFAGQNLVKDIINGFFILMQDQIRVGDVVKIAGQGGLVENVTLKMTTLRDLHGNVHYIPNGQIDVVTNMTKEFSRYVMDIGVSYREDVDEVIAVIREVDEDMRSDPEYKEDILQPVEILGLDRFDDSAVIVRARTTTKPIRQWAVGREFNRRLKKVFDARGIEIPFPHVTLYMGVDKAGQAPPLRVDLKKKDSPNP